MLATVRKLTFLIFTAFPFPPHLVFASDSFRSSLSSWVFHFYDYFNWRIIALPCRVSFYHMASWVSRNHECVCVSALTPEPLPHLPLLPAALQVVTERPGWAPCAVQQVPTSWLVTHGSVDKSVLLPQLVPPSPSPAVSAGLFCLCLHSFPAISFVCKNFSRFRTYALIYYVCFSLSDLLDSITGSRFT